MSTRSFRDNTKQQSVITWDTLSAANTDSNCTELPTFFFSFTGADFLTKEVMVGDKLVTMQVSWKKSNMYKLIFHSVLFT
jgi:hypothetical protein